uniref:ADP ribosylation factor like GTPase 14 effector protein n=1 Tax=Eptatretus burgeri TaxID=7764 RepID=A0A8C4NA32_EPTBU
MCHLVRPGVLTLDSYVTALAKTRTQTNAALDGKWKCVQTAKALRSLRFLSPGPQIKAFNPENSLRERRKLETKVKTSLPQRQEVYDERGLLIGSGLDLCDCLDEDCPGCFLACPRCSSSKCGPTCRVNRKWFYDQMDVEGGEIYRNKYST